MKIVQWGGGILESKRKNPKDLQRFTKNKKQKGIVIGSIVGILLLIGGITLYRTFAMYKVEKSFDVLNGVVPNFSSGDIKLAITLDGQEVENIPDKGKYKVEVNCDKGTANWDYLNWRLEVNELKNKTKCDVKFTTTNSTIDYHSNIKKYSKTQDITINLANELAISSTTFDFSDVEGYQYLTNDNFVASFSIVDINTVIPDNNVGTLRAEIQSSSYNAQNGILTVQYRYSSLRFQNVNYEVTKIVANCFV